VEDLDGCFNFLIGDGLEDIELDGMDVGMIMTTYRLGVLFWAVMVGRGGASDLGERRKKKICLRSLVERIISVGAFTLLANCHIPGITRA